MPQVQSVSFSRGREAEFKRWFYQQLWNTKGDQAQLVTTWRNSIEQWRSKMPDGIKEFPWTGASNLEFPLTAMHSDPVYADLMQSFHGQPQFWHVSPIHAPQLVDSANALREALQVIDRDFLKLRDVNSKAFLYNIILGTAIYKTHWVHQSKRIKQYDPAGSGQIVDSIVTTSRPSIENVPLNHFFIPADAWDIDPDAPVGGAQWVAQKFFLTAGLLAAAAATVDDSGYFPPYSKQAVSVVNSYLTDRPQEDSVDQTIRELDGYTPWDSEKAELYEVWARYDVDGDGIEEDICVVWHHETQTILRATFNPYYHGRRPFESTRFLPGFGFYGIGMAEIDEWAQATMTKLLNAQIDNVLVANTRMYAVPRGMNATPDIFPGKTWMVGPGESVGEVRLGDIYPSLPSTMGFMLQMAESRVGVSDLRQGNITDLPSRTPAATTLSILQEGKNRHQEIMASMREPFGRMGVQIVQLLAQYYTSDPDRWNSYFNSTLGQTDAAKVIQILSQPVNIIGDTFGIIPTATSAAANKEADKQQFVGVLQLVSQIYPQLVQTAMLIEQAPQGSIAAQTALSAYTGGVELLKRLLERFDIQNPEQYVPNLQALQQAGGMQAQPPQHPQLSPLGGYFGPGPFQGGAQQQLGRLLGI
jgi:hypothetical protein